MGEPGPAPRPWPAATQEAAGGWRRCRWVRAHKHRSWARASLGEGGSAAEAPPGWCAAARALGGPKTGPWPQEGERGLKGVWEAARLGELRLPAPAPGGLLPCARRGARWGWGVAARTLKAVPSRGRAHLCVCELRARATGAEGATRGCPGIDDGVGFCGERALSPLRSRPGWRQKGGRRRWGAAAVAARCQARCRTCAGLRGALSAPGKMNVRVHSQEPALREDCGRVDGADWSSGTMGARLVVSGP
jgi:hypothetical protein